MARDPRSGTIEASGDFRGWWVAGGSAIGVAFGSTPFFAGAWSLLGASWTQAFGWSAGELAAAATLFLATQTVAFPVTGWLLDRLGSRLVACASIALFGIILIGLSRMNGSLAVFYELVGLLGVTSAATNFIAYARAIATWFDRRRGLAIGLTASSQAIGLMTIPLVTRKLAVSSGWSSPLLALGCLELLVCLPAVWLLVRERPSALGVPQPLPNRPTMFPAGATLAGILGRSIFWRILVCIALEGLAIYAILPNTVFILGRTAGLGADAVAGVISLAGAAFLAGRVGFGVLLDRMQARWLFLLLLALLACGLLFYAYAGSINGVRVGAVLLGAAGGGQTDLMPYVASRYFGTRSISTVFGLLLLGFFASAAAGPVLFVSVSAALGVAGALTALAALQVVPAAIFATLRDYPSGDPA
ncbi:MFS transporter [Lichenicoccus sp.]|uniref:MFS transporter n=1 Tax=Lichenicoccus sp. TaxID=2781899 RepID=UPI003D13EDEE